MSNTIKRQITKYSITGVFSTIIHIGIASFFARFLYKSLLYANVVGFLSALTFSYVAQSKFVFRSEMSYKKAAKFILVQSASLLIAVKTVDLTERYSIYCKILLVAILLPLLAFIIHRIWTFTDHQAPR